MKERKIGLWLHISCLPSQQGIGCFGKEAKDVVDFLNASGFAFWQICPLGPLTYGDSPYQCVSSFAINPLFIDIEDLQNQGLLLSEEIEFFRKKLPVDPHKVDYGFLYYNFWPLLIKAADRFQKNLEYEDFIEKNQWIESYALFQALKFYFKGNPWQKWPKNLRTFPINNKQLSSTLQKETECHKIIQFLAYQQWMDLKNYAHNKGISIIGDLPFYPALDSSDVWGFSKNFQLDDNLNPTHVAGVPPDYFSPKGQLWGNPIYDWDYLRSNHYDWWKLRFKKCFELYDVVRIDHFRAFANFWSIPYGSSSATNGTWEKGPGLEFFQKCDLLNKPIIAEDLGELDSHATNLLLKTQFPGMKILQFAFHNSPPNTYLPHFHSQNSVLYIGTHDNDTLQNWYQKLPKEIQHQIRKYFGISDEQVNWKFIYECYQSPCNLSILRVQDLVNCGPEARFNTPGTLQNNWIWRISPEQLTQLKSLQPQLKEYSCLFCRD